MQIQHHRAQQCTALLRKFYALFDMSVQATKRICSPRAGVSYGVPTTDYPYYGKAIIGTNLWRIPIGVQLGYQPYFSDWYFSGIAAYVFSEEPIGVDTLLFYAARFRHFARGEQDKLYSTPTRCPARASILGSIATCAPNVRPCPTL